MQFFGEAAMRSSRRILLGVFGFLLSMTTGTCLAQFSGGIQGTIQDPSDAAVPKVAVTLTNTDTQVSRQAETDDAGVFRFVSLAPGPYVVSTSAAGFTSTRTAVTLGTAETRNVPIKL